MDHRSLRRKREGLFSPLAPGQSINVKRVGKGKMPAKGEGFPTAEELAVVQAAARRELARQIRDGRLLIAGFPLVFDMLRNIVNNAPDPISFLHDLVHTAFLQASNPDATTEAMRPESRKYLEQFPLLCHPSTRRMREANRALILTGYKEVADGPTLLVPRIEDFLDNAEKWHDSEKQLSKNLERMLGGRVVDEADPDQGKGPAL